MTRIVASPSAAMAQLFVPSQWEAVAIPLKSGDCRSSQGRLRSKPKAKRFASGSKIACLSFLETVPPLALTRIPCPRRTTARMAIEHPLFRFRLGLSGGNQALDLRQCCILELNETYRR